MLYSALIDSIIIDFCTYFNYDSIREQNRRQKDVNMGALRGGALRSCRAGLTLKFDKNSTDL